MRVAPEAAKQPHHFLRVGELCEHPAVSVVNE
jgi:hypothetical protein